MIIGVPSEIKPQEKRVGLTPESVSELVRGGHELIVQSGAGLGIGAADEAYSQAGAQIASAAAEVFEKAEMIVKVKEPQPAEWVQLKPHHILFTYLHLAADKPQTDGLVDSGCTAIAYETVTDNFGGLPLLTPMSEIAGRLSVIEAASALKHTNGGPGTLISGVPGIAPCSVVIIGGGVVGTQAAKMAVGLGAQVTILDLSLPRLRQLQDIFGTQISTLHANEANIMAASSQADVIIGAVLIPGESAPKLISRDQLSQLKPGAVLVDVAIDQGGCFETSRPTTHAEPMYEVDGILHYCVANMPGAVPRSSAYALNNATLPFVKKLAAEGRAALEADPNLKNGLNVDAGQIVHPAVIKAFS